MNYDQNRKMQCPREMKTGEKTNVPYVNVIPEMYLSRLPIGRHSKQSKLSVLQTKMNFPS
jgi:hypothetical protein